ncbi:expressed unknown protein [Seminavis robusta]|uniref:Uncharacterized protein n=1 Tax=Seminavis robusta TaxID=568900 RepID=A0A9N8E9U7_9STRA|nr:expressed unknown protein [Seminavis robusta]|eukprot:Sro836_g209010.1 n/a (138) ;mRNA; r:24697-25110
MKLLIASLLIFVSLISGAKSSGMGMGMSMGMGMGMGMMMSMSIEANETAAPTSATASPYPGRFLINVDEDTTTFPRRHLSGGMMMGSARGGMGSGSMKCSGSMMGGSMMGMMSMNNESNCTDAPTVLQALHIILIVS